MRPKLFKGLVKWVSHTHQMPLDFKPLSGGVFISMKALYIKWVDAKTWSNDWVEDLKDFKLPVCEVWGALVKETPTEIFLAQCTDGEEHRNIFGIPKGCILKQKKIP